MIARNPIHTAAPREEEFMRLARHPGNSILEPISGVAIIPEPIVILERLEQGERRRCGLCRTAFHYLALPQALDCCIEMPDTWSSSRPVFVSRWMNGRALVASGMPGDPAPHARPLVVPFRLFGIIRRPIRGVYAP
jgi:hypothetical protein